MGSRASNDAKEVTFKSPKRFLADLDAGTTAKVIAAAADVALIIDDGVIKDIAFGAGELSKEGYDSAWRGKSWIDTVTVESQPKIEDLLKARGARDVKWRQVSHPSSSGVDVPIKYATVSTGKDNRLVAIGRDLRAVAALQRRLMETHQDLEREYSRLREAEARYRVLFETMSEPVLVVDADSTAVLEANPAAAGALQTTPDALVGGSLGELFTPKTRRDVERLVAGAASSGRAEAAGLAAANGERYGVVASAFLQNDSALLVVRLSPAGANDDRKTRPGVGALEAIIDHLPDGLIVTNADLRVLAANASFLKMAQLVGERQAIGDDVANWLGRSSTELNMLVSSLRTYGVIRNFATVMRDRFGGESDVDVAAVAAPSGDSQLFGFSVRSTARRMAAEPRLGEGLPSSVDQVTGLVGRMPLKEIVRESSDLIEKLCIETALDIANDNRASAAEILGLSRQGLYSKLKRFGIDDSL
ncbi:MAG: transcriptional regulator PpsR [Pseudomonadota bacterium]